MCETKFKVLMYDAHYVEVGIFDGKIRNVDVPRLQHTSTTIEHLLDPTFHAKDIMGNSMVSDVYLSGLSMCEMVEVEVNVKI